MKLGAELGIDLGTANLLVYRRGRGVVMNEPTVVAIATNSKKVLAVGNEAREMLGRTPGNIQAVRPLKDGVIADYTVTYKMLEYIRVKLVGNNPLFRPRALICVPSGVTNVERRAVIKAAIEAECPVVPGSPGIVDGEQEALAAAEQIGYPVLLKAVAGGGGRGIRRVNVGGGADAAMAHGAGGGFGELWER